MRDGENNLRHILSIGLKLPEASSHHVFIHNFKESPWMRNDENNLKYILHIGFKLLEARSQSFSFSKILSFVFSNRILMCWRWFRHTGFKLSEDSASIIASFAGLFLEIYNLTQNFCFRDVGHPLGVLCPSLKLLAPFIWYPIPFQEFCCLVFYSDSQFLNQTQNFNA